ncbi:hypothetical protein NQ317_000069 [Molorchus minor]|uniref:Peptidase aspartic putative domain-containing protein n=1 Tax=Molorchus minor TaxID=1323400 RepID=A0ABQ9JK73_9CUCU|nr:hypothetical protein NQ317_000069 [Molorchus minor]
MSTEDEVRNLHARRGVLKAQITRFETFLESLSSDKSKICQIAGRLDKLSLVWTAFDEVQTNIELIQVGKAESIQKVKSDIQPNESFPVSQGAQIEVKLPQIKLPEFSGDYTGWYEFRDTFSSLISNNSKLTGIQKFYYLQSALRGEAKHVISHLEVSEHNYATAWTLLKSRFENKKGNSNNSEENTSPSHNRSAENTQVASVANTNENLNEPERDTSNISISTHCSQQIKNENYVLLTTALVNIYDRQNNPIQCRALLDSGSQSCFITEELFSNKITDNIPQFTMNCADVNIPQNLNMADPEYYKSKPIDILIGSGLFYELLSVGQIKLGQDKPILQKSVLGWLIAGPLNIPQTYINIACHSLTNERVNSQLEQFWLIEEVSHKKMYTKEESECERDFLETFQRNAITGRFSVKLPFRDNYTKLGDSLVSAKKRFYSLESRLMKNPNLRVQYSNFMQEYLQMGHMTEISPDDDNNKLTYYLPHHGVINESSITTRLRVVFDGSAKSSTNLSLNDVLKVGPTVQDELFNILIRFRKHNVVLTSDIAKMYRQVEIHPSQRDFQRIVWRADPSEPLRHFNLNTVTYGTASASFLATRCLQQLAYENKEKYPLASQIISEDMYVDDLLTGAHDLDSAKQLFKDLNSIMHSACLELRKWTSNKPIIFENNKAQYSDIQNFIITGEQSCKTLGIMWNSLTDKFLYTNSKFNSNSNATNTATKRQILSIISQVFDPLGLVGPYVVKAKLILQTLWVLKLDWDESIPQDLFIKWQEFYNKLPFLSKIEIPRQITIPMFIEAHIHAFSDASQTAYGTCIYLYTRDSTGQVSVQLIAAKSRVAPLKTQTIPRLELCGALLMVTLVQKVVSALKIDINDIFYWCDSTIVLAWLLIEPANLKTFVANRISQIQQKTQVSQWHHVASEENPADIISRGLYPDQLSNSSLWWHGPDFLKSSASTWHEPKDTDSINIIPELRNTALHTSSNELPDTIFDKFSCFFKLQRITAYCLRFIQNYAVFQVKWPKEAESDHGKIASLKFDRYGAILDFFPGNVAIILDRWVDPPELISKIYSYRQLALTVIDIQDVKVTECRKSF